MFHTKTYQGISLVSVKACQGRLAVCNGVQVVSPDVFGAGGALVLLRVFDVHIFHTFKYQVYIILQKVRCKY